MSKKKPVHISQPLKEFQDNFAKECFGQTKGDAHEDQTCISCKLPVINRIQTELGWKEYGISGLCEICFDSITGGE
jgi:hypothetical protein